ncbi:hypothetical protein [Streptomyces sp. NPDC094149]|uniref:hypothetical protein n=1 Tax=Streptomyces sp. NPDC094149 TaxID=3155079 RepID=UPI0033186A02
MPHTHRRTTIKKRPKKPEKRLRSHKVCPHCGQIRPDATQKRPKPTATAIRRAKKAEQSPRTAWSSSEPLDATQVIKGIVAAIPAALAELGEENLAGGTSSGLLQAVRAAVITEFRTRAQFVGRLCEIDALLHAQGASRTVADAMTEHLGQLQLRRVTDLDSPELFVVTEGQGENFEVLRPAYVDEATGKLALAGQLRRVDATGNGANDTEGDR